MARFSAATRSDSVRAVRTAREAIWVNLFHLGRISWDRRWGWMPDGHGMGSQWDKDEMTASVTAGESVMATAAANGDGRWPEESELGTYRTVGHDMFMLS